MTQRQRRRQAESRNGTLIIGIAAAMLAGLLYGAWYADNAHGISVDQSLRSAGL